MQEEEREDGNLKTVIVTNSVVGLNTWNLDPDPGFWPNLDTDSDSDPDPDPDPDPGLYYQL